MTSDLVRNGLWLTTVGTDFQLWIMNDVNGDIASKKLTKWGTKNYIRHEPFTLHIWNQEVQVYSINALNTHLMAKASPSATPNGPDDRWYDLGGGCAGSPVATHSDIDKKQINIFVVGFDGCIWTCAYSDKWNWTNMSSSDNRFPTFQPEKINASTDGKGRVDLVGVTVTNDLYHRYNNGSTWSEWVAVGKCAVGSRPACVTLNSKRVDIICKDNRDSKLWHTACDDGVWLGWQLVADAKVIYDPAAVKFTSNPDRIELAVVGVNGNMLRTFVTTASGKLGSWSGTPTDLKGLFSSSPMVATRNSNKTDLFGKGLDSAMYYQGWSSGWSGWKNLGGISLQKPS